MAQELTIDQINAHLNELLKILGHRLELEIVECDVRLYRGEIQIQVLADLPDGGIGIEECTLLNKSLVEAIDEAKVIPAEGFSVEVASPGLDRPLKSSKDFLRNLNYNIRLFLKEPVEGKREAVGILIQATALTVTIVTAKKKELVIGLNIIEHGLLVL